MTESNKLDNASSHDIWKTIAYSIASVSLFAMSWFAPHLKPITANTVSGAGMAAFGNAIASKYHTASF